MVGMDKLFSLLVSPNKQFFVSYAYKGYFLLFSSKKKWNKSKIKVLKNYKKQRYYLASGYIFNY
jgi:hypothetical protein